MTNTLFLRLEGPLQAWGARARWSVRDTAAEPTKSGVVGLVACALGWRDDEQIRKLARQLVMGVRCDRPGTRLTDYQTVGGGYGTPRLETASGRPKLSNGVPHVEVSRREYLCDASFLVVLQTKTTQLIEQLAFAVQHPFWPLYLGRKCCLPSYPVLAGVGAHATLMDALRSHPLRRGGNAEFVRAVVEVGPDEGTYRCDDWESRARAQFRARFVKEVWINTRTLPEAKCITR